MNCESETLEVREGTLIGLIVSGYMPYNPDEGEHLIESYGRTEAEEIARKIMVGELYVKGQVEDVQIAKTRKTPIRNVKRQELSQRYRVLFKLESVEAPAQ